MPDRAHRPTAAAPAAAAATAQVLGLTVVAHALAGGGLPSGWHLCWLVPVVATICAAADRGWVSLPVAASAVVVAQAPLHLALTLLAPSAGHAGHGTASPVAMTLAHAAAAVVSVAVLLVEFWLVRLVRAGRHLPTLTPVPASPARPIGTTVPRPTTAPFLLVTAVRGPPTGCAAGSVG